MQALELVCQHKRLDRCRFVNWLSFSFFLMSLPFAGDPDYGKLVENLARTSVLSHDKGG